MNCPQPEALEDVDPGSRLFPASWKDAAIRELYDETEKGIVCPLCRKVFRSLSGLKQLQADHIEPWSRGGKTTWQNLQLLCKPCNTDKLNSRP